MAQTRINLSVAVLRFSIQCLQSDCSASSLLATLIIHHTRTNTYIEFVPAAPYGNRSRLSLVHIFTADAVSQSFVKDAPQYSSALQPSLSRATIYLSANCKPKNPSNHSSCQQGCTSSPLDFLHRVIVGFLERLLQPIYKLQRD